MTQLAPEKARPAEPLDRPTTSPSPEARADPRTGAADEAAFERRRTAWAVLFGSLCLSAGHGLFLAAALEALYGAPNLKELGGPRTAVIVTWFLASIVLAPLAFLARRRLMATPLVVPLSLAATVVTLVAFGVYMFKVVGA